jgi:hypothetical protein
MPVRRCNATQRLSKPYSHEPSIIVFVTPHMSTRSTNIQFPPRPLSPAPTTALLLRLQPDLRLLILLIPLNLPTILLILASPPLRQVLHVLHKPVNAPVINPQADQTNAAPQHQPDHQVHPEQYRAVHHIQDFEADEQRRDDDKNRRGVGLRHEPCEQRREVGLQSARDAE